MTDNAININVGSPPDDVTLCLRHSRL